MRHKRNPIYCDGKMVLQTDTRLERPHLTIVVPRSRFKRMVLCWFGIHWHETLDSTIDKTVYPYDQMDRNVYRYHAALPTCDGLVSDWKGALPKTCKCGRPQKIRLT